MRSRALSAPDVWGYTEGRRATGSEGDQLNKCLAFPGAEATFQSIGPWAETWGPHIGQGAPPRPMRNNSQGMLQLGNTTINSPIEPNFPYLVVFLLTIMINNAQKGICQCPYVCELFSSCISERCSPNSKPTWRNLLSHYVVNMTYFKGLKTTYTVHHPSNFAVHLFNTTPNS